MPSSPHRAGLPRPPGPDVGPTLRPAVPRASGASSPPARLPWLLALGLGCCQLAAVPAGAARAIEGVFGVNVPLAQGETQPGPRTDAAALARVLVKLTGLREVAGDPRAARLLAQASSLVQQQGLASRREARVVFDGAIVQRELMASGLPFWEAVRPVTLVLLQDDALASAADALALPPYVAAGAAGDGQTKDLLDRLGATADGRGIPLVLPRLDAADEALLREVVLAYDLQPSPPPGTPLATATGAGSDPLAAVDSPPLNDVAGPAGEGDRMVVPGPAGEGDRMAVPGPLERLAARHGAELVLHGTVVRDVAGFTLVEWRLLDANPPRQWTGDAADGIDYLADLLAERYATTVAPTAADIPVRVDSIAGALPYARTLAHFRQFALIDSVAVDRVSPGALHLTLRSRAEPVKLERLVDLGGFLEPVTSTPQATLHYRYAVPPPVDADAVSPGAPGGAAPRGGAVEPTAPASMSHATGTGPEQGGPADGGAG